MVMLWNLVVLVGFVVERGGGQKAGHPTYVRRIWAHEISFFVPRRRDIAHPNSSSAQSLLRIFSESSQASSALLTLIIIYPVRRTIWCKGGPKKNLL